MKNGKNEEMKDEIRRYIRATAITGKNKNILTKDGERTLNEEKRRKINGRKSKRENELLRGCIQKTNLILIYNNNISTIYLPFYFPYIFIVYNRRKQ